MFLLVKRRVLRHMCTNKAIETPIYLSNSSCCQLLNADERAPRHSGFCRCYFSCHPGVRPRERWRLLRGAKGDCNEQEGSRQKGHMEL